MRIIFEPSDYEDIRDAVQGILDFEPTDTQIETKVFTDRDLVAEAYKWGWDETETRSDLCEALDPGSESRW